MYGYFDRKCSSFALQLMEYCAKKQSRQQMITSNQNSKIITKAKQVKPLV